MGPSFQKTLRDLEGKERQIQVLLRSVQQAQEEETAYQLAFRLAAACEQATLLARALPAYTGRLRAFQEVGGMVHETVPIDIGFTQEGVVLPADAVPAPQKGDRLRRLCAVLGVSVPAPVLPADPAAPVQPLRADLPPCLCQGTGRNGGSGTTITSRPIWWRTPWPSTPWKTTAPGCAATSPAPPWGTRSIRRSTLCRRRTSPSG